MRFRNSLIAAGLTAAVIAVPGAAIAQMAPMGVGEIANASGQTLLMRDGMTYSLSNGDVVVNGDTVYTGKRSSMVVDLDEGCRITLPPMSSAVVDGCERTAMISPVSNQMLASMAGSSAGGVAAGSGTAIAGLPAPVVVLGGVAAAAAVVAVVASGDDDDDDQPVSP